MGLVLCIGAGPAGLTAACELSRNKRGVLVLEADAKYVGGIARTIKQDGFCFDIGGHRFFSKSAEIEAWWREILGDDLLVRPRKSRIFYGGKFYPYPLNLWRTFINLGLVESVRCVLSYVAAKAFPCKDPRNLEEWVTNQFGARLFRIFFKTYTEKVWGIPCNEVAADWAAQRIKGLSLSTAMRMAALSLIGWKGKRGNIKTLIEEFLYPRKGPGMMWETAARKIQAQGGRIELNARVEKLSYSSAAREWAVTYAGKDGSHTVNAEHIISSMPLRELVEAIEGSPPEVRHAAAQLGYRDFFIVALVLEDRKTFDDNWIYVHAPEVKMGRIQNFKAWSAEMVPDPALVCYGLEYFCFEGDGLWNSTDEVLIELGIRELSRIGLASAKDVKKGYVVRQPKAYPVYSNDYESHVRIIRDWLEKHCPNLQVVGRNGMHKYNNQDHSMMTAMLAVKNILAGRAQYDVWQVNQDAEYHEEIAPAKPGGASGERLVPRALE